MVGESRGQPLHHNAPTQRGNQSGGASWQHDAQKLIARELVREGLGSPDASNNYLARQILAGEVLITPVFTGRAAT